VVDMVVLYVVGLDVSEGQVPIWCYASDWPNCKIFDGECSMLEKGRHHWPVDQRRGGQAQAVRTL